VGALDDAEEVKRVKKYLHTLTPLERDIVIMRVWQELSYKEIADIIGKTEANSKMIFSRTLKKLRTLIPLAAFLLIIFHTYAMDRKISDILKDLKNIDICRPTPNYKPVEQA
jgi:DNA-binding CsgD family transcriptional regulator